MKLPLRSGLLCVTMPGAYAVLGVLAAFAPGYEVFPFFCWFLFPVTPNEVERYGVELEVVSGERLPAPTLYEHWAPARRRRNSMDLQVAIQALGNAIEARERKVIAEQRQRVEGNFIEPPCSYVVVRERYDALEQWRAGGQPSTSPVARFTCSRETEEVRP